MEEAWKCEKKNNYKKEFIIRKKKNPVIRARNAWTTH